MAFDPAPIKACLVCQHSIVAHGELRCTYMKVVSKMYATVVCTVARAEHGACGPDARYLNFPGLYQPGQEHP